MMAGLVFAALLYMLFPQFMLWLWGIIVVLLIIFLICLALKIEPTPIRTYEDKVRISKQLMKRK